MLFLYLNVLYFYVKFSCINVGKNFKPYSMEYCNLKLKNNFRFYSNFIVTTTIIRFLIHTLSKIFLLGNAIFCFIGFSTTNKEILTMQNMTKYQIVISFCSYYMSILVQYITDIFLFSNISC